MEQCVLISGLPRYQELGSRKEKDKKEEEEEGHPENVVRQRICQEIQFKKQFKDQQRVIQQNELADFVITESERNSEF